MIMFLFYYSLQFLVLSLNSLFVFGTNEFVMNNDGSGKISFGPPSLNVEEESSFHMPAQLRCDGCRIIAHLMYEAFAKEEKKLSAKSKSLSESQIIDVADKVCSFDFKEYGITEVNGIRRLKGPGLDTETAVGVTQAGGRWPWRLQTMCNDYIGEIGEENLYQEFQSSSKSKNYSQFFKFVCENEESDLAFCRSVEKQKKEL